MTEAPVVVERDGGVAADAEFERHVGDRLGPQRGVAAIVFSDHGAAPDQDATIDLMGIRLVTGSTEPSNGPRFTIGGLVPP